MSFLAIYVGFYFWSDIIEFLLTILVIFFGLFHSYLFLQRSRYNHVDYTGNS